MIDYFALLDETRRPWLDTEKLKAKFLDISARTHPDKLHTKTTTERETANRRFVELNAAFSCLRDPRERLRHLLALELGGSPKQVQEIPQGLMELFTEIAGLNRGVNAFLAEAAGVKSPLLRVQLFAGVQEWTGRLREVQEQLGFRKDALLQGLQTLDAKWTRLGNDPIHRGAMLRGVEQIHHQLSFYTRWGAQLQEKMVQLSFCMDGSNSK